MRSEPTTPERPDRRRRATERVAGMVSAAAALVTVGSMIATPLLPQGGRGRRRLSNAVVGAMFTTSLANATRRWGLARATGAAAATAVGTGIVERVGIHSGLPFGRYSYTSSLRPQISNIPIIVPLAWFGMGLPSREAAVAALGEQSTPTCRITLGSFAMTAWDLFLDPQMVSEGYWRWSRPGAYRGIPMSNYLGWFLTGISLMAFLEAALPPTRNGSVPKADNRLAGQYAYMSIMETLGFACFFRDPLVALTGGAAMLPVTAAALINLIDNSE